MQFQPFINTEFGMFGITNIAAITSNTDKKAVIHYFNKETPIETQIPYIQFLKQFNSTIENLAQQMEKQQQDQIAAQEKQLNRLEKLKGTPGLAVPSGPGNLVY